MEHFYCNNAAPEILSWLNMLQREWGSFHNPHSVSWPKTGLTSVTMTIMGLKICSYMVHRSILGEHQFSQIFNHLLITNTFLWPLAKFSCGWPIVCEGSQSWRLQLTELRPLETIDCFSAWWNKHTPPASYQQLDARTNHCWPTVSFYDSDLHHKTLAGVLWTKTTTKTEVTDLHRSPLTICMLNETVNVEKSNIQLNVLDANSL